MSNNIMIGNNKSVSRAKLNVLQIEIEELEKED